MTVAGTVRDRSAADRLEACLRDPEVAALAEDPSRVGEFERAFAASRGAAFAAATNSGTSALHAALAGVGVAPGDEVIIPAVTASAVPMSVMLCHARPVLADIDEHLFLGLESVRRRLTDRTRAVIAVHPFGFAGDVGGLVDALRGSAARVIEDCAQSHGAARAGRGVGSRGDAAVFSFAPGKVLSAGGGGMVVTDDERIYRRVRAQADVGRDPGGERRVGNNYALSPLQAFLGLSRLRDLEELVAERRRNAVLVAEGLAELPFAAIHHPPRDGHCYYKLATLLERPYAAQAAAIDRLGREDRLPFHRWIPERFDRRDFYRAYAAAADPGAPATGADHLPVTDDLLPRLFLFRTSGDQTAGSVRRLASGLRRHLDSLPPA